MISIWRRLPVALRAALTGLILPAAGTIPWAALFKANYSHLSVIPWAILPAAVYLWLYFRYLRGAWWPQSTAEARRRYCSAQSLAPGVWEAAILAGVLGLVGLVIFQSLVKRVVRLPEQYPRRARLRPSQGMEPGRHSNPRANFPSPTRH